MIQTLIQIFVSVNRFSGGRIVYEQLIVPEISDVILLRRVWGMDCQLLAEANCLWSIQHHLFR